MNSVGMIAHFQHFRRVVSYTLAPVWSEGQDALQRVSPALHQLLPENTDFA